MKTNRLNSLDPIAETLLIPLCYRAVEAHQTHPPFRGYQARPRWGVSDPRTIEHWGKGLKLLESYGYFDQPEPRLANICWMGRISFLRDSASVLRLGLGRHEERPGGQ